MTVSTARHLRRDGTDAERLLWSELRARRLAGHKFRRQQPIGPYVVDFVCFDRRLVVEVDGGHHAADAVRDVARTRWLEDQGFAVIRFWNNQVLGEIEGVKAAILESLTARPSPSP